MRRVLFLLAFAFAAASADAAERDIGLRAFDGIEISTIAVDDAGASPIMMRKAGVPVSVLVVDPTDPDATNYRIKMPDGSVKALKKFSPSKWYQTPKGGANCPAFCAAKGLKPSVSPEGASCVSGEARVKSAFDAKMIFYNGCWPWCSKPTTSPGTHVSKCNYCANDCSGIHKFWGCWTPGQKKDCDGTDAVVACFCR